MRLVGRHRATPASFLPLLALAAAVVSAPAFAQSCSGEIERLAQQYDIGAGTPRSGSTEAPAPPAGHEPGAPTSERLGRTGGVVTPPDIDAPMSVHPPAGNPDNMPTAPPVQEPPGQAAALTDAERARMAALLDEARAAARQGKDAQCLEDLRATEAVPGVPGSRRGQ